MTQLNLEILCCPRCRGALQIESDTMRCVACRSRWPQRDSRFVDLLPEEFVDDDTTAWLDRQAMMVGEYEELVADRDHAVLAYTNDYTPLGPLLGTLEGRGLDVGGGNGIARHWLPDRSELVVLDPDTSWLDQPWRDLAEEFPCLADPPPFVRGVAERMPFRDGVFDFALSIWSLNHSSRPDEVLAAIATVLRPGGRFLLVLDDVPPTFRDLFSGSYPTRDGWERARTIVRKVLSLANGWPTHDDHLRIEESDLHRWCANRLTPVSRGWSGPYLIRVFEKSAR